MYHLEAALQYCNVIVRFAPVYNSTFLHTNNMVRNKFNITPRNRRLRTTNVTSLSYSLSGCKLIFCILQMELVFVLRYAFFLSSFMKIISWKFLSVTFMYLANNKVVL